MPQEPKHGQDTSYTECTTSAYQTGSVPRWSMDNDSTTRMTTAAPLDTCDLLRLSDESLYFQIRTSSKILIVCRALANNTKCQDNMSLHTCPKVGLTFPDFGRTFYKKNLNCNSNPMLLGYLAVKSART